jgi:hypothetical protein
MSATTCNAATPRRGQRLLASITVGVCAVAIAGCGSAGRKPSASSPAHTQLAFSECMRSHGVTGFPDPSGGGGINLDGTGINPASPAFQAAQAACNKLLPGGGPPAHASEQQKQQLIAMSECVRRHGVGGFPDPTISKTPPSNPQDYSLAEGIGDLWLLVPSTINVNSPAFKQAAKACHFH